MKESQQYMTLRLMYHTYCNVSHASKGKSDYWPCSTALLQHYFSANKQCSPFTTNQHKHQHKLNFSGNITPLVLMTRSSIKQIKPTCSSFQNPDSPPYRTAYPFRHHSGASQCLRWTHPNSSKRNSSIQAPQLLKSLGHQPTHSTMQLLINYTWYKTKHQSSF